MLNLKTNLKKTSQFKAQFSHSWFQFEVTFSKCETIPVLKQHPILYLTDFKNATKGSLNSTL